MVTVANKTINNYIESLSESEKKELKSQQTDTGDLGVETENIAALEKGEKALEKNNNAEQKVELSAQDLIRENAELFKELLNEGQKEKT